MARSEATTVTELKPNPSTRAQWRRAAEPGAKPAPEADAGSLRCSPAGNAGACHAGPKRPQWLPGKERASQAARLLSG
jgi:hypothetical protein